jgi:hypothetical protein
MTANEHEQRQYVTGGLLTKAEPVWYASTRLLPGAIHRTWFSAVSDC